VTALAIVLEVLGIALYSWSHAKWIPGEAGAFSGQQAVPWWSKAVTALLTTMSVANLVPIGDPGRNSVLRLAWLLVLVAGLEIVRRTHNRKVTSRLNAH